MKAESRTARIIRQITGIVSFVLLALLVVTSLSMAQAQGLQPATLERTNAQIEAKTMQLSHSLRCLVCQNQSIAESNAPLAVDLRNQVREQLEQGRSEQDIFDYMVARYGDFVLYQPPLKTSTLLLWLGPALLLLAGLGVLASRLRRRKSTVEAPLSVCERQQAQHLLGRQANVLTHDSAGKRSQS